MVFSVSNKASNSPDSIKITNSIFEYNARQGFSWIGGNQVYVKSCKFNHIGKAKISSAPGAGVDIEAEVSPISNGVFEDCDFIDNMGCGLVALAGDSKNCTFTNCTFFGSTNRAIWISKPNYTFNNCNIYGSFFYKVSMQIIQCRCNLSFSAAILLIQGFIMECQLMVFVV